MRTTPAWPLSPIPRRPGFIANSQSWIYPTVNIDSLFRSRVDEFVDQLQTAYPDFDSFPADAKPALLDMAFSMGTGKLKSKTEWPKLNTAIAKKDWAAAATECNRPDSNARRNTETKALFTAASQEK